MFFDKRIPLKHVIRADQDVKGDKIALIHLSQLISEWISARLEHLRVEANVN